MEHIKNIVNDVEIIPDEFVVEIKTLLQSVFFNWEEFEKLIDVGNQVLMDKRIEEVRGGDCISKEGV